MRNPVAKFNRRVNRGGPIQDQTKYNRKQKHAKKEERDEHRQQVL